MLYLPLPVWSYSIPIDLIGLLDPEHERVAVGIKFLSYLGPKI